MFSVENNLAEDCINISESPVELSFQRFSFSPLLLSLYSYRTLIYYSPDHRESFVELKINE